MKTRAYPRRSRKQSPIVADGRIDTILPPATLRDLLKEFEKDLCNRPRRLPDGVRSCDRAYFRFLFSLIVHAGIAGPDAWEEITSLRFSHIAKVRSGLLSIPRKGGEIPVALPAVTRACAASLGLQLLRSRSRSRHIRAPYPPDGFLIPDRPNPSAKPDAQELAAIRSRFLLWLDSLSVLLHRRITFNQLCDLARIRMARQGWPVVSGTLLGLHLSNPVSADQYASVLRLADPSVDMNGISSNPGRTGREFHPRPGILKKRPRANSPNSKAAGTEWDQTTRKLRKLIRPYTRSDKRKARLLRPVIRSRLERFIREGARRAGKTDNESWKEFTNRMSGRGSSMHWGQVNVLLLAEWISDLIREYPPNTVSGRFSDILQVFQYVPGLLSGWMNPQAIMTILLALRISTSSLERLSDSLRSFTAYLHEKHGFSRLDLPWWMMRNKRILREQRILTGEDVSTLLDFFPGPGPMDDPMRCGILLVRYFGLRLSELCRLRLCDVWMTGRPTVLVWNSKCEGSRWIESKEIPPDAVAQLQEYCSRRMSSSGANPAAPFLIRPNGKPFSREAFDRRIRKAIRRMGITAADGCESLATHGLRHTCANSWWLGGVAVVEVARRLGHKSLDTTIPYYIHSQPVKQIEGMAAQPGPVHKREISITAKAALYGISRRAVYHAVKNPTGSKNPQASDFHSILHEFCARSD